MSIEVFDAVLKAKIDNPAEKAVLIALANHADPDGRNCRPSVKRLMAYTSLSEATVRDKLKDLRDNGLIKIVQEAKQHKPTVYWLNIKTLKEMKHPDIIELENKAIYGGIRPPAIGPLGDPDLQLPESRPPRAGPEPSLEPSSKDSADTKKSARKKSEKDLIRGRLEKYFSDLTHIPVPKPTTDKAKKAISTGWWMPLREIAELSEWNEKRAKWLIEKSIIRLRESQQNISIGDPRSIKKTAFAIFGEVKSGVYGKTKKDPTGHQPTGSIDASLML